MIQVFGGFELDPERFELRNGDQAVSIEPKVLGLLLLLVENRHRTVEKRELLAKNWPDVVVGEASLARAVMEARRAIGDDGHTMILTVRGRGFRFAADVVERVGAPPVAPVLVGRDAVLVALQSRLDAALAGRGNTAWVTGEAGIGRSAVATELARMAGERNAFVVRVRCHEEPPPPPRWLWTQIARECAFAMHVDAGDDHASYDRFVRDLRTAARRAPIALVVEDAHRADDASVAMLRFLAGELTGTPVFLLVTYCDGPALRAPRRETLRRAVAHSTGISIPLRPLGREDVATILERNGVRPSPAVASWFHEKSGGNPRFLLELINTEGAARAGEVGGGTTSRSTDLTEGLRASIAGHLESVSARCRETLAVAALLGQTFEFPMVVAATHLGSDAVLDDLTEAVRARLVDKSAAGSYRFRHPLVRSVLARALAGTERAKAHAAIAERLEVLWAAAKDAHADELAHHWVKALPYGDAGRALACSLRAAELALTRGAQERAVTHYQRALEALSHLPGEEARGVEVRLALARTSEGMANANAREAYLDAAVLASAFARAELLAEAALGFARTGPEPAARAALLLEARGALASSSASNARALLDAIDAALAAS